jgi:hypothetical protein
MACTIFLQFCGSVFLTSAHFYILSIYAYYIHVFLDCVQVMTGLPDATYSLCRDFT